jgi:hypothetical protein
MRVKYKRNDRASRDEARMSVLSGGSYLNYRPSAAAVEVITSWQHGADIEWEVDDETRQPRSIHLTPAPRNGLALNVKDSKRPFFNFSTAAVGMAEPDCAQAADEVEVSPSRITVRIPFAFTRGDSS